MTRRDAPDRRPLEGLRTALQAMLPAGATCAVRACDGQARDVTAAEFALVARAVEKRRHEFQAGRAAARAALQRLGVVGHDLLSGPQREPLWPPGVIGSIAHNRSVAAAIVAPRRVANGLGVDLEEDARLEQELWPRICTPSELASVEAEVRAMGRDSAHECIGHFVRLAFSLKEAVYKAQYPASQRMLGFHDVSLDLDVPAQTFRACIKPVSERLPTGAPREANGGWRRVSGWLVAVALVP